MKVRGLSAATLTDAITASGGGEHKVGWRCLPWVD